MKRSFLFLYILLVSSVFAEKIILQTEFYKGFDPVFFEEDNIIKGYGVDVIKEINQRSDLLEIKYENILIPLNRVKSDLETGSIDLVIFLAKNSEREKIYDYLSVSWYDLNTSLYTYSYNSDKFIDLNEISKKERILGVLGSNSVKIAKNKGFTVDTAVDFESVYMKFLTKRWKYFVHVNVIAESFLAKQNKSEEIFESVVLETNSHFTVLKKGSGIKIKRELERIVREIKADGTVDKLLKKYY